MPNVKIDFYLRFYTQPGQSLHISGNIADLGDDRLSNALPMQYKDAEFWHANLEVEESKVSQLRYHYLLKNEDGTITEEWGEDRVLCLNRPGIEEVQVMDTWNHAGEFDNAFFTSPFQRILIRHPQSDGGHGSDASVTHVFKVKAPLLKKEEILCLAGSGKALRDWNTESPLLMELEGNWWVCRLHIPKESFPIEYKYGVWHRKDKEFIRFEDGPNRLLPGDAHIKKINILHDGFAHLPNNTWRGAGVAIPVFSLRSKRSFGVGEFTDLKGLVDWARRAGLKLIQILPINDTTANHNYFDSYPYAAISAFALHPLYLNLEKAAGHRFTELIKPLRKRQKELNALAQVDYEQVMKIKLLAAKELYNLQQEEFLSDDDFREFFEGNRHWLEPYAVFCYLRDKNGTPDFSQWKLHNRYDADAIAKYAAPGTRQYHSIALHYFIQYHLHLQLRDATNYAHKHGIVVKGDIPIGIYRYSCDAWMEPNLYHMDQQAGAPPDNFAVKGQNWGFPTYNWEEMEKDGFSWWRRRFEQMSKYFDAFRIDHILGFFRIWSIPMQSTQGIMGHFEPVIPVFRGEFNDRRIPFDHDRYVRPFINDAVLWELFGPDSDAVKAEYLEEHGGGWFTLKPAFNTQRKIEEYFLGKGWENGKNGGGEKVGESRMDREGEKVVQGGKVGESGMGREEERDGQRGKNGEGEKVGLSGKSREGEKFREGAKYREVGKDGANGNGQENGKDAEGGKGKAHCDKLQAGLLDLISNVILLEVEGSGGQQFHFRIDMENTSSFRYLDWDVQQMLKSLYVDYFYSRQDEFWRREALRKLPPLKRATNMLVCGEDLGMVPRCVPNTMKQLGILSLEIQRMPKNTSRAFSPPSEAPYLSVVTPSTHDMSTIRGWWEEDRDLTQRFFNKELGQWGEAPVFCEPWINKAIVLQHLHSPAMWSIFQLQDILGMSEQFRRENPHDERINIPAEPHHYWNYRVHISLEELVKEKEFNEELRGFLESTGRL